MKRWAALVAPLLLATACSSDFGAPESVTEQGDNFITLWKGFLITAVIIGLIVYGLIIFTIVRYRRGRGDPDRIPDQRQYQVPIEVVYTVIPIIIVAVLFGFTVVGEKRVTDTSDDPDLTVEVIGFQWQWQFRYEDSDVVVSGTAEELPELVLPVGETVRFELVANDVNHSFWVPHFLEKRDLIPGVDNAIDVDVTQTGTWAGRCAEFCGLDHWKMDFTVRAVSSDDFAAWLADQDGSGS